MTAQRLTKRQKRLSEKGQEKQQLMKFPSISQLHLNLQDITPITDNQIKVFNHYEDDKNLCLLGCPGTGKTFVSIYLAMKEIAEKNSLRRKLVIVRSAQSSKDIGFLPGDEKKKLEVYESAYRAIFSELYHRSDAYEMLKQKGIVEFCSTSFLRGTTIDDSIILLDEVQNLSTTEWYTVLSRTGENSRVVVCGDAKQDDLTSERYKQKSGIHDLTNVFGRMDDVESVYFDFDDIVRSGFVKSLIIAYDKAGL